MPYYQNISKYYKKIIVNGRRINIPPSVVISSDSDLDLNILDFLKEVDADQKIEVIDLNSVSEKKNKKVVIDESIIDKIKEFIKYFEENKVLERLETVERRQGVLKTAIDEMNSAFTELEKTVYEEEHTVIQPAKNEDRSISDIMKKSKK